MKRHTHWRFDLTNDNWDSVDEVDNIESLLDTCLNECPFFGHNELVVARIVEINDLNRHMFIVRSERHRLVVLQPLSNS